MYKTSDYENVQLSFVNFNTTCGMQLDVDNEWIQKASWLPWRAWYNKSADHIRMYWDLQCKDWNISVPAAEFRLIIPCLISPKW